MTTSVAISETGMAMVGMIVVRQLCRKTKTTSDDEQQRLGERDQTTSCIAAETKRVVS